MGKIFYKKEDLISSITKYLIRGIFFLTLISTGKAKADNCTKIGEIGDSGVCNGMLIVNRDDLKNAIADDSYTIHVQEIHLTYEKGSNKNTFIFIEHVHVVCKSNHSKDSSNRWFIFIQEITLSKQM